MASRGLMVAGTSGADYEHREQVAAQYQISVLNKSRLRYAVFFHVVVWAVLAAKLSSAVLDALDVFILELEELALPPPRAWEWLWALSPLGPALQLAATRRNSAALLRRGALLTVLLAVAPLLLALLTLAPELLALWQGAEVAAWRGRPQCALWLAFLAAAAQVHAFELLAARRLLAAWARRGQLRNDR